MILLFGATLIILFLAGVPIAYALGFGAMVLMVLQMGFDLNWPIVAQRTLYGVNSFIILAIPFFLLAGKLMNTGGMTERIFKFANCLVGHFSGGLGHVNIVASMIFSGMTGAAASDAAGLGAVEIKAMRDVGYDDGFSVAVTAASSIIGPIIPPSIPLVVYGLLASESVGKLLIGGILPGILVAISLFAIVYVISKKNNYPKREKASLRELSVSFLSAAPALFTPVIIVGGILGGIFTPTESAAVAAFYALILAVFIYREIDAKRLWQILHETMVDSAVICLVIGTAMLFGWVLIRSRLPIIMIEQLTSITTEPILILFILNGVLLVIGCFMETVAALSILVPVVMPLLDKVGIDPLHFGLVMVLNLMIGLMTPPLGTVAFILHQVSGVPLEKIFKAVLPFLIPLFLVLVAITIAPPIVTFLPNALMTQ